MSGTNIPLQTQGSCPYCSTEINAVYHFGGMCPKIKAIEYHPNGDIKRVEFLVPGDYMQPLKVSDWGNSPVITWGSDSNSYNGDDFRGQKWTVVSAW